MKDKAQRRVHHVAQLKTVRTVSPITKGANQEAIIASKVGTSGKKVHKKITIDSQTYYVELKTSKE